MAERGGEKFIRMAVWGFLTSLRGILVVIREEMSLGSNPWDDIIGSWELVAGITLVMHAAIEMLRGVLKTSVFLLMRYNQ